MPFVDCWNLHLRRFGAKRKGDCQPTLSLKQGGLTVCLVQT
jgi:hypothetical protein